jgi:hypothetical protein
MRGERKALHSLLPPAQGAKGKRIRCVGHAWPEGEDELLWECIGEYKAKATNTQGES